MLDDFIPCGDGLVGVMPARFALRGVPYPRDPRTARAYRARNRAAPASASAAPKIRASISAMRAATKPTSSVTTAAFVSSRVGAASAAASTSLTSAETVDAMMRIAARESAREKTMPPSSCSAFAKSPAPISISSTAGISVLMNVAAPPSASDVIAVTRASSSSSTAVAAAATFETRESAASSPAREMRAIAPRDAAWRSAVDGILFVAMYAGEAVTMGSSPRGDDSCAIERERGDVAGADDAGDDRIADRGALVGERRATGAGDRVDDAGDRVESAGDRAAKAGERAERVGDAIAGDRADGFAITGDVIDAIAGDAITGERCADAGETIRCDSWATGDGEEGAFVGADVDAVECASASGDDFDCDDSPLLLGVRCVKLAGDADLSCGGDSAVHVCATDGAAACGGEGVVIVRADVALARRRTSRGVGPTPADTRDAVLDANDVDERATLGVAPPPRCIFATARDLWRGVGPTPAENPPADTPD